MYLLLHYCDFFASERFLVIPSLNLHFSASSFFIYKYIKKDRLNTDFLFIVTPIVGVCNCSMFCCTLLYVNSSIAIILMGKRELISLLNLSSWCLVMVERLFLAVPRGCLQFVIVVFPDHNHLLFLTFHSGPCAQRLSEVQSASQSLLGTPVPECDYDGYYIPRQCSGSE